MDLNSLDHTLATRRTLICCGTGGVGKTTLSAALALRAARSGRKVCVITIDPSRRLMTALGLSASHDEPQEVRPGLWALVPEAKRTFEQILEELGPNPEFAAQMKANPIFQMVARDFSGAHEYMALLKLARVMEAGVFDLIVLDTPPSRNLVGFLNSPLFLEKFYSDPIFKWILMPSNRLLGAGVEKIMELLERLTGKTFVSDLFAFTRGLFAIQQGFLAKLATVSEMFASAHTGFVFVTSSFQSDLTETEALLHELGDRRMNLDVLLMNRSLAKLRIVTSTADSAVLRDLQKQEQQTVEKLELALRRNAPNDDVLFSRVPELLRDIHGIDDLEYLSKIL